MADSKLAEDEEQKSEPEAIQEIKEVKKDERMVKIKYSYCP